MALSVDSASAVIGRPLTPGSVAGVNHFAVLPSIETAFGGKRTFTVADRSGKFYIYGLTQNEKSPCVRWVSTERTCQITL